MAAFLDPKFISTMYLLGSSGSKKNIASNFPRSSVALTQPQKDILKLDASNNEWDPMDPIKKGLSGVILAALKGKGPEIIKQAFNTEDDNKIPTLALEDKNTFVDKNLTEPDKKDKSTARKVTEEILDEAIETFFKKVGINSRSVTAAVATSAFAGAAVRGAHIATTTGNIMPLATSLLGTYVSSKATEFFAKQSHNKTHVERLKDEDTTQRGI